MTAQGLSHYLRHRWADFNFDKAAFPAYITQMGPNAVLIEGNSHTILRAALLLAQRPPQPSRYLLVFGGQWLHSEAGTRYWSSWLDVRPAQMSTPPTTC